MGLLVSSFFNTYTKPFINILEDKLQLLLFYYKVF